MDNAFGIDVDYAMITKHYGGKGPADASAAVRYSPSKITGTTTEVIKGQRNPRHISTSFVERQNWTVRTHMRRYTRLSNGFSRKLENHTAAVALNYFVYNFIRISPDAAGDTRDGGRRHDEARGSVGSVGSTRNRRVQKSGVMKDQYEHD